MDPLEKKILIVGASGMVGSNLLRDLNFPIVASGRSKPEWLDPQQEFLEFDPFSPESDWQQYLHNVTHVIFLSFPTQLDELESLTNNQRQSFLNGFEKFISNAKNCRTKVAFFSSDAALWGIPTSERFDKVIGIAGKNEYARLKIECEKRLLASGLNDSLVLRCTPIGFHAYEADKGLLGKMVAASKTATVKGFSDVLFTPVSIAQITSCMRRWIEKSFDNSKPEIIHLSSTDAISKFDLLRPLIENVGGRIDKASIMDQKFKAERVFDQSITPSNSKYFDLYSVNTVIDFLMSEISYKEKQCFQMR